MKATYSTTLPIVRLALIRQVAVVVWIPCI